MLSEFEMAMGVPLPSKLSNLYMEFCEKKLFVDILPFVTWFRYTDDDLWLWPCSEDVDSFLTHLNSLVPSVKFMVEVENDRKLPFFWIASFTELREYVYLVYIGNYACTFIFILLLVIK